MKNPVAKYMNKFNKAATPVDKKKKERKEPYLPESFYIMEEDDRPELKIKTVWGYQGEEKSEETHKEQV